MNYSLLLLVFFVVVPYIHGTISDWRLCADPECRGAVSQGVASVNYKSIEPMVLSFNAGDEITIYSKEAGQNKELWGAEVRGKRGYIPKRLIREMRIFVRSPTHSVPTELVQPTVMQPPSGQSTFVSQQPQQPQQPPLQQGGPKGNFVPYQQPLPHHMNPQYYNNNQLPNQPVPMQPTQQLHMQQQPNPSPQQPMQAVPLSAPVTSPKIATTTTEAQIPSEINEVNAMQEPSTVKADFSSNGQPPVPVSVGPSTIRSSVEDVKAEKDVEEVDDDEEEGDEADENEPNDFADDEADEEEEKTSNDSMKEAELSLEPSLTSDSVDRSSFHSDDTFQVKNAIDPIIEIGDLSGVDSSPINSLHFHSLEEKIETPLVNRTEALASASSTNDMSISNTSQTSEDSQESSLVSDALPEAEKVKFLADHVPEVYTASQEFGSNITGDDARTEDLTPRVEDDASEVKNAFISPSLENEFEQLNETKSDDNMIESTTSSIETLPLSETVVNLEVKEPLLESVEVIKPPSDTEQIEIGVPASSVDAIPENQERTESSEKESQEKLPVIEEPKPSAEQVIETIVEEAAQVPETESPLQEIDSNESSSPIDEKKTNEDATKVPGTEGSGGGFIDSALNWLGLSDTEESLKMEQTEVDSADPASLLQQIASMDPNANHEAVLESAPQHKVLESEINGFCDTQDCGKLQEPIQEERDHAHSQDGHHDHHHDHDHDGHHHHGKDGGDDDHQDGKSGHDQHGHGNDGHDHHHHNHDGHDHHGHDHHGHSHGHGHSHIPGYIPGFRHHYKPPAAQQPSGPPPAEIPPPPPPLEKTPELPIPEQPIPPPIGQETNPLPPLTEYLNQAETVLDQTDPSIDTGHVPNQVAQESSSSVVPDYIPVEEIFRAEMEKNRLLQEQQQQQQEQSGESLFDSFSATLLGLVSALTNVESGNGEPKSGFYPTVVVSMTLVTFLILHYAVQNKSGEKLLKARISQLDSLLYESQSAREDTSSNQTKLTEYETNLAELRSQQEVVEMERVALSRRVTILEKERDSLEKEVESATEAATEANRMFEELLASQSENDQWQHSVEVLQQQLNKQQQTMENLNSSLCVKTAENETLAIEVEELRTESERYKIRIKTLQGDLETLKTSNRNYQQKMAQEGGELMKLKQEKEAWASERRTLSSQINRHAKEIEEWRDKVEQLKKTIRAKDCDLAKSLQLLKQSGNDSQTVLQLTSLVQLESELSEANQTVERLTQEVKTLNDVQQRFQDERAALELRISELQASGEAAAREKREAETRLEVLSNYFKEKETQLQKELGTHEAKRAITEENVSESVKKILETEESLTLYKSQVETLSKEIEEQERSYKSRLATQEKRAHENWVAARQLERRLEESKQEAAQLRHRLTQVEKDKEALLVAKENGTANGAADVDLIKPVIKRPVLGLGVTNNDDLTLMEHPPLLSPPIPPPPPGMELGLGGPPPPPGMPFDSLFPPPHFIPPAPFMPPDAGMMPPLHLMPSIPPPPSGMLSDHHRPPPLGMIATGSFDVDYRRDLSDPPPPRRYPSPPRRYPSPLGSERSGRSDRSDRMDRYDDHFRPVSPYGRHGGRPRSVGRSRDVSPERPRSYSPLPSPLYPPHTTIHSPEEWDDGRNYNRQPPMMRSGSLRHPPSGPKTSSPLIQPMDNGDRHRHHH